VIRGFGINNADAADWNDFAIGETTLPWLQDPPKHGVWESWHAGWRDVFVLDGQNRRLAIYPVYDKPLDDPANYAELKALLLRIASGTGQR
jgi:hypothetical protein